MPKSSVAWIGGSGGRQLCLSCLRSSGAALQSKYSVYRVHAAATNHTQHATYAAICNAQHATVTYAAICTAHMRRTGCREPARLRHWQAIVINEGPGFDAHRRRCLAARRRCISAQRYCAAAGRRCRCTRPYKHRLELFGDIVQEAGGQQRCTARVAPHVAEHRLQRSRKAVCSTM